MYYLYYLQLSIVHPPFLPRPLCFSVARFFFFFLLAPPVGRRCSSHTHFMSSIFFYRFFFKKRFNINTHTGALVEAYVYLELVSSFSRAVTLFPFSLSCVTWSTNRNKRKEEEEEKKRKRKEREEKRKRKRKTHVLLFRSSTRSPFSNAELAVRTSVPSLPYVYMYCVCNL